MKHVSEEVKPAHSSVCLFINELSRNIYSQLPIRMQWSLDISDSSTRQCCQSSTAPFPKFACIWILILVCHFQVLLASEFLFWYVISKFCLCLKSSTVSIPIFTSIWNLILMSFPRVACAWNLWQCPFEDLLVAEFQTAQKHTADNGRLIS
jgi:hypothetical protein